MNYAGLTTIRVLVLLFAPLMAFAQSGYPQDDIKKREAMIAGWDQQATLQSVLEIMVIVFGAAITVVQGFQKGWAKPATIAMGACTTVFSAVNTKVFPTDRRELRAAVVEGNRIMTKLHHRSSVLIAETDAQKRADLGVELEEELGRFDDVVSRVTGAPGESAKKTGLFSTPVYAMPLDNPCGLKVKSDSLRFYYVGVNRNPSVSQAKDLSQKDAIEQAVRELTPKGLDPAAVRQMLEKLAVVDDTAYVSSKDGQYTYCTLIRINKTSQNLLRTAPPARVAVEMKIEPGELKRLSSAAPAFLYLRKIRTLGGLAVADVCILESASPVWNVSKLKTIAFQAAIAKMTERKSDDLTQESYVQREVRKGDTVVLKLSGGQNLTLKFTDVKYVLGRVEFTVGGV